MKGLYIHIPFCIKKCLYCDFVSASCSDELHKRYFDALKKEISLYRGAKINTVFIGGGTPSSVDEKYILHLLEAVYKNFSVSRDAEITIEANPGTLNEKKLSAYKAAGINRISIGAQSMQDRELKALGRIHLSHHIIKAAQLIKSAGLYNFNIDLMLAIPHQNMKSLSDTLSKAVSLSPAHISAYSLIIEEKTPFYDMAKDGTLDMPDEDTERDMYDYAVDFLERNGYKQYEISNFAKSGFECRHNLKYWHCMPYIGIGCAVHSYDGKTRYANTSDISEYINLINEGLPCVKVKEVLSENDKISEYIIMALRLREGIIFEDFYKKFGFSFEKKYDKLIKKYVSMGFFDLSDRSIRFTQKGISISNSILSEFV